MKNYKDSLLKSFAGSALDFILFFAMCVGATEVGVGKSVMPMSGLAAVTFLLCCYGLTTIVVDSAVAWPFSKLAGKIPLIGQGLYSEDETGAANGLLSCSLCTGMWIGAILAALGVTIYPISEGLAGAKDLVVHGIVGAGWAYVGHKVVDNLS